MSRSASTSRTTTRQTKRARTGQDLTLQENSLENNSEVDEDEAPVSFACSQEILRPGDVCSPEIHDALDFDEDTSTADTNMVSAKWERNNHDRVEIRVNGVSSKNLEITKRLAPRALAAAKNLLGMNESDTMTRLDCVHVFLDRNFHLQLEEHIRRRGTENIMFEELVGIQKIWML